MSNNYVISDTPFKEKKLPPHILEKILRGELNVMKTYTKYELRAYTYNENDELILIQDVVEQDDVTLPYSLNGRCHFTIHPWVELKIQ